MDVAHMPHVVKPPTTFLRARVRDQILAAYDLPTELTDAWKAIHDTP